jgi:hypothetical protein
LHDRSSERCDMTRRLRIDNTTTRNNSRHHIITTIRDRSDLPTSERLCRDTETRYSGNAVSVSVSANSHSFLASS